MDIWRCEGEDLEDFITRFNKECLEIGGVSEDLMRAHFKKATRCDSLIRTITGRDRMPKSGTSCWKQRRLSHRQQRLCPVTIRKIITRRIITRMTMHTTLASATRGRDTPSGGQTNRTMMKDIAAVKMPELQLTR
ncbi:hypothetical protein HanPI659440_Chr03g0109651 [Helianthus annuus]|nr:hypothetical protein HanPI659440_Chr03g0109651 [Helianthus annuus]